MAESEFTQFSDLVHMSTLSVLFYLRKPRMPNRFFAKVAVIWISCLGYVDLLEEYNIPDLKLTGINLFRVRLYKGSAQKPLNLVC